MNEVYVKLIVTFIGAGIMYWIMHLHHKKKVRDARITFELMMKSRGLSLEILEKEKKDENHVE